MPDLTDDLRRYGAAMDTRVAPVDVDSIIAGVHARRRRFAPRTVILAVAAALVVVALAIAVMNARTHRERLDTVGQPGGATIATTPGNPATSSPPNAPTLEVGPPGEVDPAAEAAFAEIRAEFPLPPGGQFLEPEERYSLPVQVLRETVAFQASCAWLRYLVDEVDVGADLTRAAAGLQDLNEREEIDDVMREYHTTAVAEAHEGRTTTADEIIAGSCTLPAESDDGAFINRMSPAEIAASTAAMDPEARASFAEIQGYFATGRHPVVDHHGNTLGYISTATLDSVARPTAVEDMGEAVDADGNLTGYWAGDLGAFTLAEVADPGFDPARIRRSLPTPG